MVFDFDPPKTKSDRLNHHYLMDAARRFEWDMHHKIFRDKRIPPEWHEIAATKSTAKAKVTMALDADVIKFMKSMGPGYQRRINDVLRTFMHMKLRGLLNGMETREEAQYADLKEEPRPGWGTSEAEEAEIERLMAEREAEKRGE